MIFENVQGIPIPRLPRDANGVLRVANGKQLFDLEEAATHFKWSEHYLQILWQCTWDDALQPAAKIKRENRPRPPRIVIQVAASTYAVARIWGSGTLM
jgi:hypothetical protein